MSAKDRAFFLLCYFLCTKMDASSITQNGHVRLFSAATSFVFSGDVCKLCRLCANDRAVRFALCVAP